MPSSLNGIGVTFNDGTQLQSANEAGGDYDVSRFTSPATWTKPAGLKAVKVTLVGGGGGGGGYKFPSGGGFGNGAAGAGGGVSITYLPAASIPGPVSVTVGAAGAGGVAQPGPGPVANAPVGGTGGTSSFGAFASATGGAGGFKSPAFDVSRSQAAGSGTGGTILNAQGSTNEQVSGRQSTPTFDSNGGGNNPLFLYEYGRQRASEPTVGNGESATANSGCGGGAARAGGPTGSTGHAGGAGGAGLVIVEEFY